MYSIPYTQDQLKYKHQSRCSPTISTLANAISNGFLTGFQLMKSKLVQTYLATSPATSKGKIKQPLTGIRGARPKDIDMVSYHIPIKAKLNPSVELQQITPECTNIIPQDVSDAVNNIFCFAALACKKKGTLYTDATGALSAISSDGHLYFFVAYDYDTNYYFAEPIANVTDVLIVDAFDNVFTELTKRGFKSKFNVTDNQATGLLKTYIAHHDCK